MNEQVNTNTLNVPAPRQRLRRSGVGTGTTSLLMIFTVLCFATLAVLSLSTAASDRSIQRRGIDGTVATAAARGAAAEAVAELDAKLLALRNQYPDEMLMGATGEYFDEALALAGELGFAVDEGQRMVSIRFAVDEGSELVTELVLNAPDAPLRYTVLRQSTELLDGWQPEGENLWEGPA